MKTPEKDYFQNFLAETPTGVYNKNMESANKNAPPPKKKGFFSCCAKNDDENELNMTRKSMRPII
jgi:hypothetical protein